jgi:hypothetical protein
MYGADHSVIFSTQVTPRYTVQSIMYRYKGLSIQCTVSTTQASYGKDVVLNTT